MLKLKYLCKDLNGFMQLITYLVSRGYYYHCVIILPEKKRDKFDSIDKKLIDKYDADKSKYQRSRQKIKKKANFYYLRLEKLAILLHTEGDLNEYSLDDNFKDIRKKNSKLTLPFSEFLKLDVILVKEKDDKIKTTVKMSPDMYNRVKDSLLDAILSKKIGIVYKEFNKLYGLPGYAELIKQEQSLLKFTLKQCSKHQLEVNKSKFRINTFKNTTKVFE